MLMLKIIKKKNNMYIIEYYRSQLYIVCNGTSHSSPYTHMHIGIS